MSHIKTKGVSVEFPVYSSSSQRSLKKSLLSAVTGGVIGKDNGNRYSVKALDNINLDITIGDRLGVIGPNGSGKSTLLQLLAGIYEPTSGEISVEGKIVPMLNLALGMDIEFSGYDNIKIRSKILGMSNSEIDNKIEEIIEFSGIGEFINLPMKTYSSGMVMRLMFSIVTTVNSDIVLMDEWMSVGDSDFSLKADLRLKRMISESKILVIASHNHELIESFCNKIIRLDKGRIV